eukprot:m.106236 g.106236  ORF g.106236 m.106236 type:complete len:240 (+) comp15296_c2_seq54:320-1039(+)
MSESSHQLNDVFSRLCQGCEEGNLDDVKQVLASTPPDQRAALINHEIQGIRPLSQAASGDHTDVISYLLDVGADVDARSGSSTALHVACVKGNPSAAQILIARGADVDMTDEYNQTALYTACITGFDDIAEMLISQGANVNVPTVTGLTPLHFASLDVAKHLIRAGANVNAVSKVDLVDSSVLSGYYLVCIRYPLLDISMCLSWRACMCILGHVWLVSPRMNWLLACMFPLQHSCVLGW